MSCTQLLNNNVHLTKTKRMTKNVFDMLKYSRKNAYIGLNICDSYRIVSCSYAPSSYRDMKRVLNVNLNLPSVKKSIHFINARIIGLVKGE